MCYEHPIKKETYFAKEQQHAQSLKGDIKCCDPAKDWPHQDSNEPNKTHNELQKHIATKVSRRLRRRSRKLNKLAHYIIF
jgi:hypothetical protein